MARKEMKLSKFKKKYKAIIFDVDGTLIPNAEDGMPSKKVTIAVKKASKKMYVGIASGRPYFMLSHIVKHLKLSGPIITNNGAKAFDVSTKKVIFEQLIERDDIIETCLSFRKLKIPVYVQDNERDVKFTKKYIPQKPFNVFGLHLKPGKADLAISAVSHLPSISVHKIPGWKKDTEAIIASHVRATKQYAVLELAKYLKINTHEIIVVGDGENDLPLFMAAGLRIAMGNAVPGLKEIADYIAPSVEDDGVAHVIEKFVL